MAAPYQPAQRLEPHEHFAIICFGNLEQGVAGVVVFGSSGRCSGLDMVEPASI